MMEIPRADPRDLHRYIEILRQALRNILALNGTLDYVSVQALSIANAALNDPMPRSAFVPGALSPDGAEGREHGTRGADAELLGDLWKALVGEYTPGGAELLQRVRDRLDEGQDKSTLPDLSDDLDVIEALNEWYRVEQRGRQARGNSSWRPPTQYVVEVIARKLVSRPAAESAPPATCDSWCGDAACAERCKLFKSAPPATEGRAHWWPESAP